MRLTTIFSAIALAIGLSACDNEVQYDPKALGFSGKAEMEAAFERGYHTKQKLMEMMPAAPKAETTHPAAALQIATSRAAPAQEQEAEQPAISQEPPKPAEQPAQQPALSIVYKTPFAPSFDCAKVSNGAERLICGDRELSKLDVEMAIAYSKARGILAAEKDKKILKDQQLGWMKFSRNACSDKPCMVEAYKKRIAELGI